MDPSDFQKGLLVSELRKWNGETQTKPESKRLQEINPFVGMHDKGDLKYVMSESSGTSIM